MKYQLSETDKRIIDRVSNITLVDYEIDDDNYIEVENLIALIDDLETKYNKLEDTFVEFEEKVQENYVQKKFDPYYEYGVNENEFH